MRNRYMGPDYIVAQPDWGTTAAPDSAPSPDQPGGSSARPSRGKDPATTGDDVDNPSRLDSLQTRPARRSRTTPPSKADSTLGPILRGMKNKSTDPTSQPSKRRLYKNNILLGKSSTDPVSASGSESVSTLPPSTDATPTGTPRSPAPASPDRAPSLVPMQILDDAVPAPPTQAFAVPAPSLPTSSMPVDALSATDHSRNYHLHPATNRRSRQCATFSEFEKAILETEQQLAIARLNHSTLERDKARMENNRLTKDNTALRQQAAQHTSELASWVTKVDQLQAEVLTLQQANSAQQSTIARLQGELATNTTTIDHLRTEGERSTVECGRLQIALDQVVAESTLQQGKISELLHCNEALEVRARQLHQLRRTKRDLQGRALSCIQLLNHMLQDTRSRLDLYSRQMLWVHQTHKIHAPTVFDTDDD